MPNTDSLYLTVHVPASDWAAAQRRVRFLEALLLRVVKDRSNFREWWTADELARLDLPGLPAGAVAIGQRAARMRWPRKREGVRNAYHFSALPPASFDALLAFIVGAPALTAIVNIVPDVPEATRPGRRVVENAAPPWVLPLMRLMKGKAEGDMAIAWRELPSHLPPGVLLPTIEEAAEVLIRFGLA